jgi:NADH dehydrogenase
VAKAVLARGEEVAAPFQLVYLGILAYLGGQQALAQIRVSLQDVDGPGAEGCGVDQGGLVGWIMWRGVYVVKQIALRNRVRRPKRCVEGIRR